MTTRPQVKFLDDVGASVVEWLGPQDVLMSHGRSVYSVSSPRRPAAASPLFDAPVGPLLSLTARWDVARRLTRSLFTNVLRMPDGSVFYAYGRQMGIWRAGMVTRISGARLPMRCLRGAIAMLPDGTLYLGEYDRNPERRAVRVYRLAAGSTRLEVAREFSAGEVRHVHGIYQEPGSARLWCLTGDVDGECRIAVTDDDFRNLTTIGCGDETWRAVSLAFVGGAVVYGTDAEFRQNHFYTIDTASGRRERLAPVDGPVYFSTRLGDGALFSVTAEGCPSQAVNQASLWWVSPAAGIHRLSSYPKDCWHRAFMFGMILFALGPGSDPGHSRAIGRLHALARSRGRSIEITFESAAASPRPAPQAAVRADGSTGPA